MRSFEVIVATALLLAGGSAQAQFACNTEVRFHFIGVHRDDGSKGPAFDPAQLAVFVSRANAVFGPAGLTFSYRQAQDWEEMNSTLLWHGLRAYNGSAPDQLEAATVAQRIADARPGKIVVFFREDFGGDYAAPRLLGSKPINAGWQDGLDYISFWGFSDHPKPDLNHEAGVFAHELGHYLGLYHTHPSTADLSDVRARERLETMHGSCTSDANCTIASTRCVAGQCRETMDGDPNVSDNTEDPSPSAWLNGCPESPPCPGQGKHPPPSCACGSFASIGASTVATSIACTTAGDCGAAGVGGTRACIGNRCSFTWTPSLTNVMSYYGGSSLTITPGQLSRVQASINAIPSRNLLCNVPCWPNFHNLPISSTDTCLNYWRYRDGLGPHALTVDWSGTLAAGSLRSNSNGWVRTSSREEYENQSFIWPLFSFASNHYSWRPNAPLALGMTRQLTGASSIQTFHRLDWGAFVSKWNLYHAAGRALVDVSVTRANPLELSAVWASLSGQTSATYWVANDAEVKNLSNAFYASRIRLDRVAPVANGSSHTLIANWNFSTALRGLWSVPNTQYQSLFGTLSGLGYVLHDLEYFENGGLASVWEAPHNECTAGSRLHKDTDVCTRLVCESHSPWADPYCCNSAWDSICVGEVTSWCGRACPP